MLTNLCEHKSYSGRGAKARTNPAPPTLQSSIASWINMKGVQKLLHGLRELNIVLLILVLLL